MRKRPDLSARNTTHGLSRTRHREYRSWKDMRSRCRCETDSDYPNYGARGISIDPAWDDFSAFYRDMGDRPQGFTLDRIDTNENYRAGNCRWASAETQANNQRRVPLLEFMGRRQSLAQWSREFGIYRKTVAYRLSVGMSLEQALSGHDYRR